MGLADLVEVPEELGQRRGVDQRALGADRLVQRFVVNLLADEQRVDVVSLSFNELTDDRAALGVLRHSDRQQGAGNEVADDAQRAGLSHDAKAPR